MKNIRSLPIIALLLIVAILSHPWTAFQYLASMVLFLMLSLTVFKKKHVPLILSLAIVAIFIAIYIVESPSIVNVVIKHPLNRIMAYNFEKYVLEVLKAPSTLYFAITIYLWGSLNTPLYPMLSVYGLEEDSEYFLVSLTATTAIIMLLIVPSVTFISRLILNLHLPILAACTIAKLNGKGKIAIFTLMLAYTLRTLLTTIPNPELEQYLYLT